MRRKEVEDVMGGRDAWANVDRTDGKFWLGSCLFGLASFYCERREMGEAGKNEMMKTALERVISIILLFAFHFPLYELFYRAKSRYPGLSNSTTLIA